MKKVILHIGLSLVLLSLFSCNQPTSSVSNPTNETYEIGDLWYQNDQAVGVVFYTWNGGENGYVISLDEAKCQWSTEKIDTEANSKSDGILNNNYIVNLSSYKGTTPDDASYPAVFWCKLKGDDWFLGSKYETSLLFDVLTDSYSGLTDAINDNGTQFTAGYYYWTSSQMSNSKEGHAWCPLYSSTNFSGSDKDRNQYARAMRIF